MDATAYSWSVFLALQYLSFHCLASPVDIRETRPQITAAPVLGAIYENELLRRQDSCTYARAVCAMYAPCATCISLSNTPAGMDCCTSKLADQNACPTGAVPAGSTIFIYTLGSLTLYGNPTSLVIADDTLTPGGTPATVEDHTLSIPAPLTAGAIIEDGTATTLGYVFSKSWSPCS